MIGGSKKEVMFSHSDGETWGLDVSNYPHVVTSGDDNKVIVWDTKAHKKHADFMVTDQVAGPKKGGASTLSDFPASQCARAVACQGDMIVTGGNDGCVTFNV